MEVFYYPKASIEFFGCNSVNRFKQPIPQDRLRKLLQMLAGELPGAFYTATGFDKTVLERGCRFVSRDDQVLLYSAGGCTPAPWQ